MNHIQFPVISFDAAIFMLKLNCKQLLRRDFKPKSQIGQLCVTDNLIYRKCLTKSQWLCMQELNNKIEDKSQNIKNSNDLLI